MYINRVMDKTVANFTDDPDLAGAGLTDQQVKQAAVAFRTAFEEAKQTVPWNNDKWLYRMALGTLCLLALISIITVVVLAFKSSDAGGVQAPQLIVSLGSAAVGALVGLFAKPPTSSSDD